MSENKEKFELLKKAFEYKNQEKYKEAIELLTNVLKINENSEENVEILTQIADMHFMLKDIDAALNFYQKALSINIDNSSCIQKCFDIYFSKEQYQKALNLAQKICERNKNSISYFNYFKTLYKLDKKQDILEIFNTLDESIKLDVNILYLISLIDKDKKEILLNKIIELDDSFEAANLDLAKIALEKSEYDKVFNCCINLDENIPFVSYCLGKISSKNNETSKAIEYYIKAIKQDKNQNDYYFDLAKAYLEVASFSEALKTLKYSINFSLMHNQKENLDEKYFLIGWLLFREKQGQNALLNLGLVDENSRFYDDAQTLIKIINLKENNISLIEELEKLYHKKAPNQILIDTLANTYKNLNMPKKAISMYLKALELYPDSLFYKLELIDLYIDINMYNEALELIEKVTKNNANCVNIYNSLARIYFRLKDYSNALRSIDGYLALDKNNPESHYFKGLILNQLKDYQNAKASIYCAINLDPNNSKYYSQMANSYFNLEQYEEALLYAKEAIEINPNEINYKKQAFEIAQKIGNKNQIELFEKQLKRSEAILKSIRA